MVGVKCSFTICAENLLSYVCVCLLWSRFRIQKDSHTAADCEVEHKCEPNHKLDLVLVLVSNHKKYMSSCGGHFSHFSSNCSATHILYSLTSRFTAVYRQSDDGLLRCGLVRHYDRFYVAANGWWLDSTRIQELQTVKNLQSLIFHTSTRRSRCYEVEFRVKTNQYHVYMRNIIFFIFMS